jgi:hypothetical protein
MNHNHAHRMVIESFLDRRSRWPALTFFSCKLIKLSLSRAGKTDEFQTEPHIVSFSGRKNTKYHIRDEFHRRMKYYCRRARATSPEASTRSAGAP